VNSELEQEQLLEAELVEEQEKPKPVQSLFQQRGRWVQGYYAMTKEGEDLRGAKDQSEAVKFCLIGGIEHQYHKKQQQEAAKKRVVAAICKYAPDFVKKYYNYDDEGAKLPKLKDIDPEDIIPEFNDNPSTKLKDIKAIVELAKV
jgi:hypothetical protein